MKDIFRAFAKYLEDRRRLKEINRGLNALASMSRQQMVSEFKEGRGPLKDFEAAILERQARDKAYWADPENVRKYEETHGKKPSL